MRAGNTLAAVLLALVVVGSAHAQADGSSGREPRLGWYSGGGVGGFRIVPVTLTSIPSANAAGGFGTIGYAFFDNYGAELRLGGVSSSIGTASLPGAPAGYPLGFGSLLGKVGTSRLNRLQIYLVAGVTAGRFSEQPGGTPSSVGSISYGGGLDGNIGDRLTLGADFVRYITDVDLGDSIKVNADGATVSLRYRF